MILSNEVMYTALLEKDASFEGTFFAGIKTTGIFCRPSCTARKPKKGNVEFFYSVKECMANGYRPCLVCKPLDKILDIIPPVKTVLEELAKDPSQKITDDDLKAKGIEPTRLRRWFLKQHGITFQAYQRMLRLNNAIKKIKEGETVTAAAFENGFDSLSGFGDSFKNTFGITPKNSKQHLIIDYTLINTPLGAMIACANSNGICLLEFTERKKLNVELKQLAKQMQATIAPGKNQYLEQLEIQLAEYFSGIRKEFDVSLSLWGTEFQKSVWESLRSIPYGENRSYKQQAHSLQKPESVRAVANANGSNRIAIIIPCHRVVGSDGKLTGYAGGLWRKKYLLELEAKTLNEQKN